MAQLDFSEEKISTIIKPSAEVLNSFRDLSEVQNLYCMFPGVNSACKYYRVIIPFRTITKLNYANTLIDSGHKSMEDTQAAMMGSDMMLWYGLMGRAINDNIKLIRGKFTNALRERIPMFVPPLMIYDTDDNNDWVHPANPAFVTMGFRNIDGTILDPDDPDKRTIYTKLPNGESVVLWEDRVTKDPDGRLFDVKRNLKFKELRDELIKTCDGVTVSCDFLKQYFIDNLEIPENKIHVFPNCVDINDYPKNELKEHPEEIRIIWQGGASHNADLYPIKEAIEHIIQKYDNVKLVVWGGDYGYFFSGIPQEKLIYHDWVSYDYYREKRTIMNADINLCPLSDNTFSRAKTAIKWYEGSILDRPEATLAAKVGPYKDEIQDGETGLLYEGNEQLVEKLSVLIENAELRKKLGDQAKKWVIENRNPEKHVPALFEFYKRLRGEQVLASGVTK